MGRRQAPIGWHLPEFRPLARPLARPPLRGCSWIRLREYRPWVAALLARRPTKVAAIALANKLARMAWAMMARGERYNYPASLRV
jgi:hypothetical protein